MMSYAMTHWLPMLLCVAVLALAQPASAQPSGERFRIPSGSMQPALLPGTVVSSVKYAANAVPARGDIIAFRVPKDPKTTYLMRVIGLPGERVQMINGLLHINGDPVKREKADDFQDKDDGKTVSVKRWRETLPNGVIHDTLDLVESGPFDNTAVFTVPDASLFVLGDNRDNAQDSRLSSTGYVPMGNVVARITQP